VATLTLIMSDAPYREPVPPQKPPDAYAAFWTAFLRRRRWGWAGLGLLPLGVMILHWTDHPFVAFSVIAASLGMLVYASPGKCPRCGKSFGRRGGFHNQFTLHCLNCGITVGTLKGSP
jgi:hypothetical protein